MNRKIHELAEQAGFQSIVRGDHIVFDISTKENLKEFAELIIRECAQVCINLQDIPATEPRHCAEDIKIHFGVE